MCNSFVSMTSTHAVTKETIPVTSDTQRLFVVTGGPGSGKTTLIDALAQADCARSIEAGRGVIQDQVAIGGPALPGAARRRSPN